MQGRHARSAVAVPADEMNEPAGQSIHATQDVRGSASWSQLPVQGCRGVAPPGQYAPLAQGAQPLADGALPGAHSIPASGMGASKPASRGSRGGPASATRGSSTSSGTSSGTSSAGASFGTTTSTSSAGASSSTRVGASSTSGASGGRRRTGSHPVSAKRTTKAARRRCMGRCLEWMDESVDGHTQLMATQSSYSSETELPASRTTTCMLEPRTKSAMRSPSIPPPPRSSERPTSWPLL